MKYLLISVSALCLGLSFSRELRSGAMGLFSPTAAEVQQVHGRAATSNSRRVTSISDVVAKAATFKSLLTSAQVNTLQQTYSATLAHRWSNLPCGIQCRNGLQFSNLTTAQQNAALAVIQAAAGTSVNEGFDEFSMVRQADSLLGITAGSGYSKGIYFIAFLNNPSETGAWMLQFGGHHYASNIAFNNGMVVGATPVFEGIEPKSFTNAAGRACAPIDQEHSAMVNLFASLTTAQLSGARLTQTFSDVLLGPNQDGNFPAVKAGLKVGTLSAGQKALVLEAIKPWVNDADDASAAELLSTYEQELDNTYIAYSGSAALSANANYTRIDGPSVWIEFVCQTGVVFPAQIHYHTVWRDHLRDYGSDLSRTALAIAPDAEAQKTVTVFPNPASDKISISLPDGLSNASLKITMAATGQQVYKAAGIRGSLNNIDVSGFAPGIYMVSIRAKGTTFTGRFVKL
ncbi:MAG: DUF3500 domain-containing protein [Bacteroidota bacterium]